MLIERLYVPSDEASVYGLKEINMTRLGQFIALTGKNGAGKTRLLSLVTQYASFRINQLSHLADLRQSLINYQQAILQSESDPNASQMILQWKNDIRENSKNIEKITNRVIAPLDRTFSIIPFVPKQLALQDPRHLNKAQFLGASGQTSQPGIHGIDQHCLAYIQSVQDKYYEATHPNSSISQDRREELTKAYSSLTKLVFDLLKSGITRTEDSNATIFGRPLGDAALSDGQKVILQLVAAIHAQKGRLDDTVFVLDEPENHLHPSALVEFLNILAKSAANSQIFIATHSLPLLSYISSQEPMSIWYMEDGNVGNAGRHPETVLQGLLGDEEQVSQLHAFTSLPAQFAAINFTTESLTKPKVVKLEKADQQVSQIAELIGADANSPQATILDFGAGKGRLLAGLSELEEINKRPLAETINYLAFEPFTQDHAACSDEIHSSYGNDKKRLFSSREEFFSNNEENSIDTIVMCNVLHEISPSDWLSLFDFNSLVFRALKDSGYLLVVEDQRIPTGEKAHQFGFLILSTPHLRTLFKVTDADIENRNFLVRSKQDGRLQAHLISKGLVSRITSDSRHKAITELRATALDRMKTLRNSEPVPTYKTGQEYAFWTQEFANATLFLEQA